MSKILGFEVSSTMTLVEPEGALATISSVGASVFDKPRKTGYFIGESPGIRPKDQHFRTVEKSKVRFVHFDRVTEPYMKIGAEYLRLLMQIDPRFKNEEFEDSYDLEEEIAKELKSKIGETSIIGHTYEFNRVDDVPSIRDPGRRLFVLRQGSKDEDPIDGIDVIDELGIVSGFVGTLIKRNNSEIYNLGSCETRGVENGLLIATTDDLNPDRIQTFKNKLKKELFINEYEPEPVRATVTALSVDA